MILIQCLVVFIFIFFSLLILSFPCKRAIILCGPHFTLSRTQSTPILSYSYYSRWCKSTRAWKMGETPKTVSYCSGLVLVLESVMLSKCGQIMQFIAYRRRSTCTKRLCQLHELPVQCLKQQIIFPAVFSSLHMNVWVGVVKSTDSKCGYIMTSMMDEIRVSLSSNVIPLE